MDTRLIEFHWPTQPYHAEPHLPTKQPTDYMQLRYFLANSLIWVASSSSSLAYQVEPGTPSKALAEQYLESLGHYKRLSGVVLVAKGDEVLFEGATGWANKETQTPMQPSHVLGVGSLSKQFTATAIVKLASEGKLGLHDPVNTWLPDWSNIPDELTLHHLLTHTSGLNRDIGRGDTFTEIIFPEETSITLDDLLGKFSDAEVEGKPGDSFDYNNLNYHLLVAVVERAADMPFEVYVQQHLFEPNQVQVYSGIAEVSDASRTSQYMAMPNQWDLIQPWHWRWLVGAGNFATTAQNMNDWISALQDTTFLPREYAQLLTTGYVSEGGSKRYGYGWEVSKYQGQKRIEHDGAVNGYVAQVIWLPETDLRVIVMTNHTHDLEEIGNTTQLIKQIANDYLAWAEGKHLVPLPMPDKQATSIVPGTYTMQDGRKFEVIQAEGTTRIETQPLAEAWSILDFPFLQELEVAGRKGKVLEHVAQGFGHAEYRRVLRKSSLVIRLLLNPERIGSFWNGVVEDAGAFQNYRIYRLPDEHLTNTYWIALDYENQSVGLSLYFKGNRINGMFIDQQFTYGGPDVVSLIPVSDGKAFVDGFRLGYADAWVTQEGEDLMVEIQGKQYLATRQVSQ